MRKDFRGLRNPRHSEAAFGETLRMKKSDIRQVFGRNIEQAMERRGINQERLSKLSGLSSGHISEMRRGISAPTLDSINELAHALQVGPWELLVDEEAIREEVIRRALAGPSEQHQAPPRKKDGAGANH